MAAWALPCWTLINCNASENLYSPKYLLWKKSKIINWQCNNFFVRRFNLNQKRKREKDLLWKFSERQSKLSCTPAAEDCCVRNPNGNSGSGPNWSTNKMWRCKFEHFASSTLCIWVAFRFQFASTNRWTLDKRSGTEIDDQWIVEWYRSNRCSNRWESDYELAEHIDEIPIRRRHASSSREPHQFLERNKMNKTNNKPNWITTFNSFILKLPTLSHQWFQLFAQSFQLWEYDLPNKSLQNPNKPNIQTISTWLFRNTIWKRKVWKLWNIFNLQNQNGAQFFFLWGENQLLFSKFYRFFKYLFASGFSPI